LQHGVDVGDIRTAELAGQQPIDAEVRATALLWNEAGHGG
jgi:hypothetical protein